MSTQTLRGTRGQSAATFDFERPDVRSNGGGKSSRATVTPGLCTILMTVITCITSRETCMLMLIWVGNTRKHGMAMAFCNLSEYVIL
jgi:hypothetical protein